MASVATIPVLMLLILGDQGQRTSSSSLSGLFIGMAFRVTLPTGFGYISVVGDRVADGRRCCLLPRLMLQANGQVPTSRHIGLGLEYDVCRVGRVKLQHSHGRHC